VRFVTHSFAALPHLDPVPWIAVSYRGCNGQPLVNQTLYRIQAQFKRLVLK